VVYLPCQKIRIQWVSSTLEASRKDPRIDLKQRLIIILMASWVSKDMDRVIAAHFMRLVVANMMDTICQSYIAAESMNIMMNKKQ
jgi:hypothetical protein